LIEPARACARLAPDLVRCGPQNVLGADAVVLTAELITPMLTAYAVENAVVHRGLQHGLALHRYAVGEALYSAGVWQICHTRGQWMGYFRANTALLRRRGDNMKLFIAAIAVATITAAGAAHAVDGTARAMPPPEEVSPAPYNWTGPFFGVSVGVATGTSQQTASTGDITPNFDLSGGVFGFALGYNWQANKILFGVDTDMSLSTKHGTSGYFGAPPGFVAETSERWLATYRGRVAYVAESWMIYLTGGGANADVKIIATEPAAGIATESKLRWGWTAGVGVEAARIHSFTVKAEYLYVDFANTGYFNPAPPGFINRAGGVSMHDHILRLGLNHKFPGF
jgi:outer membrane immunogenic protein